MAISPVLMPPHFSASVLGFVGAAGLNNFNINNFAELAEHSTTEYMISTTRLNIAGGTIRWRFVQSRSRVSRHRLNSASQLAPGCLEEEGSGVMAILPLSPSIRHWLVRLLHAVAPP